MTGPVFVYISASLVIIPVIYTTVVMNKRNASFFSCVVFLSIALTHSFDDDPYLFVLDRVVDTLIGIIIGVAVNDFRLPVRPDESTLYISGIKGLCSFRRKDEGMGFRAYEVFTQPGFFRGQFIAGRRI